MTKSKEIAHGKTHDHRSDEVSGAGCALRSLGLSFGLVAHLNKEVVFGIDSSCFSFSVSLVSLERSFDRLLISVHSGSDKFGHFRLSVVRGFRKDNSFLHQFNGLVIYLLSHGVLLDGLIQLHLNG